METEGLCYKCESLLLLPLDCGRPPLLNLALIAHCENTGNIGALAFADRRAVGSRLVRVHPGYGVCASLGVPNPLHLDWCFKALQKNITPEEALITALNKDPERAHRQVMLIDREGIAAVRTGKKAPFRSRHFVEDHFAAGGTGLRTENGLDAFVSGYQQTKTSDLPLENRLLAALEEAAFHGVCPKSEPQSASVLVYGQESYPLVDLRVDCSDRPVKELRRLVDQFHDEVGKGRLSFPSREDFGGAA